MYHSVGNNSAFFTVSLSNFMRQMNYIKNKYNIIPLVELVKKIRGGEDVSGFVAVTFDDGYLDNHQNVLPIIKKLNIPITIFIPTNYIGKSFTTSDGVTLDILREREIDEMLKTGLVSFMSHTDNHLIVTEVSLDVGRADIEKSRKKLQDLLGTNIGVFAYPKGKYNKEVIYYLKNSGWLGAVTVEEGINNKDSNPFLLKRNSVDSGTDFTQFKVKASGAIYFYSKLKNFLRK